MEKFTKEQFEHFAQTHIEVMKKAEEIWSELLSIDHKKYEYFKEVEYVTFEENSDIVSVSGWDGRSSCGIEIPKSYFYDEFWLDKVKLQYERKRAEEQAVKEAENEIQSLKKEKREREEYERLDKIYGRK